MKKTLFALSAITAAATIASQAAIILDTDFADVTKAAGAPPTATGITWSSTTGEAANASTSFEFAGSATGFITNNVGAGDVIGVAGNIETDEPWSTSFTFTPAASYDITSFEISSFSIASGGTHQGSPKEVTWALEIAGAGFLGNETQTEPGGNSAASFSFDTTGTTLNAGTEYIFNLTVSSTETNGNNIALNQLTLNGIPEPSTALLGALGMLALLRRRRA